ncbi:MAG: putative photosynthetic complex assembly protein PuhE, partial [Myxococcota bacterium]
CPPEAKGWKRFVYATAIVIHHELALAATAVLAVAMTWDAPNQAGTATFLVLWIMRLSAKFNVFLGVQNLTTEFIPGHLAYMLSYFRRAPMNPLMPISVLAGAAGVTWLVTQAFAADVMPFRVTAITLVATTLTLAVVEHILLVVPVPDAVLWRWAHPTNFK